MTSPVSRRGRARADPLASPGERRGNERTRRRTPPTATLGAVATAAAGGSPVPRVCSPTMRRVRGRGGRTRRAARRASRPTSGRRPRRCPLRRSRPRRHRVAPSPRGSRSRARRAAAAGRPRPSRGRCRGAVRAPCAAQPPGRPCRRGRRGGQASVPSLSLGADGRSKKGQKTGATGAVDQVEPRIRSRRDDPGLTMMSTRAWLETAVVRSCPDSPSRLSHPHRRSPRGEKFHG